MKSNFQAQKRPLQERSETPLKSHCSPPILGAAALKHPASGSQAAKLLRRLDQLSLAREHLYGVIVIHAADEIEGLQAAVYGADLHDALVSPILSCLRSLFPTCEHSVLDASWSLTADAGLKQRPFELTLRIPSSGWQSLYSIGLRIALHSAVDRYSSDRRNQESRRNYLEKTSANGVRRNTPFKEGS
jgi:hypothetical protein